MSDSRNTLRRLLNQPRTVATTAIGFAVTALTVACADGVTAPGAPRPGAFAAEKSAAELREEFVRDSVEYAEDARKDSVDAAKDSVKAAAKERKALAKAQLDSLKADWEAYKKQVKRTGEKAEPLRCEPRPRAVETKRIGPKGGDLNVGPHRLVIPAGALDHEVEITAVAPSGPRVDVQFAPHGLQFRKPVEMTMEYKGCIVADDVELGVTYTLDGWWAVEQMAATDNRKDRKITALTDHFSGYLVTMGRKRTY